MPKLRERAEGAAVPLDEKTLAARLPGLRDERSVAGLGALLATSGPWAKANPIVEGLLTLGGPEALNHLAELFERQDELMKARKKPIAEKILADYGVDPTPRLKVLEVREPEKRRAGTRVTNAAELVERLRERGVI